MAGIGSNGIFQDNTKIALTDPPSSDEAPKPHGQDYLLLVLWRKRMIIGACAITALIVAGIYLLFATPIFTSTARMSVTLAGSYLTGQQSIAESTANSYLATERELILSPAVLSLAAQSPEVRPLLKPGINPIKYLQEGLYVEVGKHDTVISVSFLSPDRDTSAKIANAVVAAYAAYQTTPKPADTAELDRLAGERAKLEQGVAEKTRQMFELEQKYGVLTPSVAMGSLAERQLGQISQELHLAHSDTLKLQSEYAQARFAAASEGASGDPDDSAEMVPIGPDQEALLRTEILQLDARVQDLRAHYLPQHPYILAATHDLARVRATYARTIEREYQVAQLREKDLQTAFDTQQKQAIEVSAATAQYLRLQMDLASAQRIVEQIDSRRREVELARDLGMLNIDPFERAVPELTASRPKKLIILGIALALGLMMGGGVGFLHDWLDDRFRTIDEVSGHTGLQLLGIMPRVADGLSAGIVGQQVLLDPLSAAAEACRMIRTTIHFAAPADRRRTLLVTSPSSGEGKSTMAANLAIMMAQSGGKRVLLIDADLRMPTQQHIFHLDNEEGLSGVLQGRATLEQTIQTTEIDGLYILPAGPDVHNPAEMLNSPVFTEMLDTLFDRYDQIIIDSPPVVGLADARIIAASCDMTILVLRAGKSTRRTTDLARRGLASVGAQVLGAIVNDATERSLGAYTYYNSPRVKAARKALTRETASSVED